MLKPFQRYAKKTGGRFKRGEEGKFGREFIKVHEKYNLAKFCTEHVKLIFGKSQKFVGQQLKRFQSYFKKNGGVKLTPPPARNRVNHNLDRIYSYMTIDYTCETIHLVIPGIKSTTLRYYLSNIFMLHLINARTVPNLTNLC